MKSFDFMWNDLLSKHGGVAEFYKTAAEILWDTFTLEQQRLIYRCIRDKLRAGKFVHYNPVLAIKENAPKPPRYKVLTYDQYVEIYHTDLEKDGWRRVFQPEKHRTIYVKQI